MKPAVDIYNDTQSSNNKITKFSDTSITINNINYVNNIIITNTTVKFFYKFNIQQLSIQDIINNDNDPKPDIVLFSSKNYNYSIINREVMQYLIDNRIGFELMNIEAVCRTFNFLISENRYVTAIIFFKTE